MVSSRGLGDVYKRQGKTADQKRLEYEAAEMSARIRHKLLSVIAEKMDSSEVDADEVASMLNSDLLRLMKDSEDRAHGTPKATTEIHGADNGPVAVVQYTVIDPPKRE